MPRFLFVNPPLVLDEDFIDYPYFANHGLLACAGLAARAGAQVEVYDAFALPASGRHRAPARRLRARRRARRLHRRPARTAPYDVVVLGASVFLRIEAAHAGDARADRRAARAVPARGAAARATATSAASTTWTTTASAVLAQYPELDAILKYPGERCFGDPEYLATLRGARRVLSDAGARGGDPLDAVLPARRHRPRPLRSLPRPLLRRRRAGRTPSASAAARARSSPAWAARTAASSAPAIRAGGQTGRKLYQPIPLARLKHWAYLLRTVFGARKLHRARRDGERAARLRGDAARLQRPRPDLRLPQRHARRPPRAARPWS